MAISSENRKTGIFTGDGKTTRYPFDFRILKTEHIAVITDDAIGNEHVLSEGRDYTAALETDGGHIDLAAPLGKGRRLVIVSNQPYLQPAVFTNHGGFYPANLNDALDKLVIQDQQIREQVGRALKVSVISSVNLTLPAPSPGKGIGWNADGSGLENNNYPEQAAASAQAAQAAVARAENLIGNAAFELSGQLPHTVPSIAKLRQHADGGRPVLVAAYYEHGTAGGGVFIADLSDQTSPDDGGMVIVSTGGTRWKRQKTQPDLYDFGALGNYEAEDTHALAALMAWAASNSKQVVVPRGVFRITKGMEIPEAVSFSGVGSARIATFPQTDQNKRMLRPGFKHRLAGSVLVFSGDNDEGHTIRTSRDDKFASFKPMLSYNHATPNRMVGISIIQDMDIYTEAGVFTDGATDNRAKAYQVGYATASSLSLHDDFNIFGYFDISGMVVFSMKAKGLTDAEYAGINNCIINSGLSVVGSGNAADNVSLTGLLASNSGFYGCDHHHRKSGDYTIPALYIDGAVSPRGIRGHSFSSCQFRTYANEAVKLDRCDDIAFTACVTEFSSIPKLAEADKNGVITATANTHNLRILGMAATADIGIDELIKNVSGKVQIVGAGGSDDAYFGMGRDCTRIIGDRGLGDSIISLTDDLSSVSSGWTIRRDGSEADRLDFRYNGAGKFQFDLTANALRPAGNAFFDLGGANYAWRNGYFSTAPIVTSDARAKRDIGRIPEKVLQAWRETDWVRYRFADAVEEKGAGARFHSGLIAQEVERAFAKHGLDAHDYGLICLMQWPQEQAAEEVRDAQGRVVENETASRPYGERLGLRMEECFAMEAASLRGLIAQLETRIAELEKR